MGGRASRQAARRSNHDEWIGEVSDARLKRYERLTKSAGADRRLDGSLRRDAGDYFRDLVKSEVEKRGL